MIVSQQMLPALHSKVLGLAMQKLSQLIILDEGRTHPTYSSPSQLDMGLRCRVYSYNLCGCKI